ncbi:MAG TPA: PHB depolymerase family esterase [Candidatus Acidoferrales bacterium]|nr:PHB depolymerase family esterase [Candidatus Acidoferrales bacterium]
MKLRGALRFCTILLVHAALFCANPARAQDRTEIVKVNGFPRSYEIHLPAGYTAKKTYPVVLALHGAGGDASAMAHLTHLDDTADKHGFIVVYPNARDARWTTPQNENVRPLGGIGPRNRGIGFPDDSERARAMRVGGLPVHDTYYFNELLDQLESKYSVDTSRIYATGLSDGGFMDFWLACELAGRIAAVAPVAATMPQPITESCSDWSFRPVPILMIHGTTDPIVSYNGRLGFGAGYFLLSAKETLKFWAKTNDCKGKPSRTTLPPNSPEGLETHVDSYGECKDNSEAILYSVVKGGHTWPGGEQYLPETVVGKTSADLDANELIWKFFSAHPMPPKQSPPGQ